MFSIIIPVYNDHRIKFAIESILANQAADFEIIIVDNNSSDPELKKLISAYPVKYVLEQKAGSYIARNTGAKHAQGDVLIFIDSDCTVDKNWLSEIKKNIAQVDGLMGKIQGINNNIVATFEQRFYEQITTAAFTEKYLKRIDTRNFIIKKEVFNKLGGFNDQLKYGGDMEFGARLHQAHYQIIFCAEAIINHTNETDLNKILNKRIAQNFDNYNILKFHDTDFVNFYFPHLIKYQKNILSLLQLYIFFIILIKHKYLNKYLYKILPINLQYYYFKFINICANKYGQLLNIFQKQNHVHF